MKRWSEHMLSVQESRFLMAYFSFFFLSIPIAIAGKILGARLAIASGSNAEILMLVGTLILVILPLTYLFAMRSTPWLSQYLLDVCTTLALLYFFVTTLVAFTVVLFWNTGQLSFDDARMLLLIAPLTILVISICASFFIQMRYRFSLTFCVLPTVMKRAAFIFYVLIVQPMAVYRLGHGLTFNNTVLSFPFPVQQEILDMFPWRVAWHTPWRLVIDVADTGIDPASLAPLLLFLWLPTLGWLFIHALRKQ